MRGKELVLSVVLVAMAAVLLGCTGTGGGGGQEDRGTITFTLDGTPKAFSVYCDGGYIFAVSGIKISGVFCNANQESRSEEVLLYFPGKSTGTFSLSADREIAGPTVFEHGSISYTEQGGAGFDSDNTGGWHNIVVTSYGADYIEGTFEGKVTSPGWDRDHTITNGHFRVKRSADR